MEFFERVVDDEAFEVDNYVLAEIAEKKPLGYFVAEIFGIVENNLEVKYLERIINTHELLIHKIQRTNGVIMIS